MGMKEMPVIKDIGNGRKFWTNEFPTFKVKVLVEKQDPLADIVNFGYMAPYLIVFEEKDMTPEEEIEFADKNGFSNIARKYSTSVVFVYPTSDKGWEDASPSLFCDLIANSRIHEYFTDGVVTAKNRFTGQREDNFIRGAIFRTSLYGYGKSADYIAGNLLKTVNGQFLWGPGEITPACVTLERLSVIPDPERNDIPVVSVGNPEQTNSVFREKCKHHLIKEKSEIEKDFSGFVWKFKRWVGALQINDDTEELGMKCEPGFETVKTSKDNNGDDKGTAEHRVGYVAWYNNGLLDNGKVPTLLTFHGGGDSAFYIAYESGWYRIANKYGFLLISIENHLNSTATEMMELVDKLKEKYPIDEKRLYASGFSMGGCKSWDMYQEYPERFAALAPMDATFEVGLNVYGQPAPCEINRKVPVPVFYSGGEETPLPELPFQAEKCFDRIKYLFEVNRVKKPFNKTFEDQSDWENRIWSVDGDRIEKIEDKSRDSILTLHCFEDEDGKYTTVLGSISGQGHECRVHTCEQAWKFMSQFER